MEPPKRLGNLRLCKETSDGSSEFIDLDTLMRKLASRDIEDQRCAAGEHCSVQTSLSFSLSCTHIHTITGCERKRTNSILHKIVC